MTRHRSLYSQWLVASQLGETSHWPTARSASTHLRATGGPVGLNNKMGLYTYHLPHPENTFVCCLLGGCHKLTPNNVPTMGLYMFTTPT